MWLFPSPFTASQQLWPWLQDVVAISPTLLCWCLLLVSVFSTTDAVLVHGNTDWCCFCLALLMMLPLPSPFLTPQGVTIATFLVSLSLSFLLIFYSFLLSSLSLSSCLAVILVVVILPAIVNVVIFWVKIGWCPYCCSCPSGQCHPCAAFTMPLPYVLQSLLPSFCHPCQHLPSWPGDCCMFSVFPCCVLLSVQVVSCCHHLFCHCHVLMLFSLTLLLLSMSLSWHDIVAAACCSFAMLHCAAVLHFFIISLCEALFS